MGSSPVVQDNESDSLSFSCCAPPSNVAPASLAESKTVATAIHVRVGATDGAAASVGSFTPSSRHSLCCMCAATVGEATFQAQLYAPSLWYSNFPCL